MVGQEAKTPRSKRRGASLSLHTDLVSHQQRGKSPASTRTTSYLYPCSRVQRWRRGRRLSAEYCVEAEQGCSAVQRCLPSADALWNPSACKRGVEQTRQPEKSRSMTLRKTARERASKTLKWIHGDQPCACQMCLKRAKGRLLEWV